LSFDASTAACSSSSASHHPRPPGTATACSPLTKQPAPTASSSSTRLLSPYSAPPSASYRAPPSSSRPSSVHVPPCLSSSTSCAPPSTSSLTLQPWRRQPPCWVPAHTQRAHRGNMSRCAYATYCTSCRLWRARWHVKATAAAAQTFSGWWAASRGAASCHQLPSLQRSAPRLLS
jgi:hypothetical protein